MKKLSKKPKSKAKAAAKGTPNAAPKAKAPRRKREPKVEQVPDARLGKLVRYYDEGWRCGHLEDVKGQIAYIRPIGAYKAAPGRLVRVPLDNIEVEPQRGA